MPASDVPGGDCNKNGAGFLFISETIYQLKNLKVTNFPPNYELLITSLRLHHDRNYIKWEKGQETSLEFIPFNGNKI